MSSTETMTRPTQTARQGSAPAAGTRSQNPQLAGNLPTPSRKRRGLHGPDDSVAGSSNIAPTNNPVFLFPPAAPQTPNPFQAQSGSNNPAPAGGDPDDGDDDPDEGNPPPGNGGGGPPGGGPPGGGPPGGNAPLTANDRDNLAEAISSLTAAVKPRNRAKTKAREPDQFDGSDPEKLKTFIVQCELYFRGSNGEYDDEVKRINFALSYLKGSALRWFEPFLLHDPLEYDDDPDWSYDWSAFLTELRDNFGLTDPKAEAAEKIDHLEMKENWKITRYNVEFNSLASELSYPQQVLYHFYHKGLPDRIKDPMSWQKEKPTTYPELRRTAQQLDARYWERQRDKARSARSKPKPAASGSSNPNNSGNNPPRNSGNSSGNSGGGNSGNSSNHSAPRPNPPKPSNSSASTPSHLGKDGKLTPAERKRRMDNKLCLFCAAPGHMARDCPKSTSSAAKGRAAALAAAAPKDSKK